VEPRSHDVCTAAMTPTHFSRILCPVSLSDTSQRTVDVAAMLAAAYDAELRLFHAVPGDCAGDRDAETLTASLFAFTRHAKMRLRVSAAVGYGDPAVEIRDHARLMRADLIVTGVDRRSAPRAANDAIPIVVTKHSTCPVLIVRPPPARFQAGGWQGFTEILSCVDFLPASLQSAEYALALAELDHARVTLLNVLTDDANASESIDEGDIDVREHLDAIRGAAHSSHGVEAVLTGEPGPEIIGFANRVGSDLIVVGAHSGTLPGRKLGATTAHVIAHAPCPVLIVPVLSDVWPMGAGITRITKPGFGHDHKESGSASS